MINQLFEEITQESLKQNGKQLNVDRNKQKNEGETMLKEMTRTRNRVERFIVRPARMDDVEAAVEMFKLCSRHMIDKDELILADVRTEWLLPEFDLETSTRLVVTPEGQPVGYIEVWDLGETPVRIWTWGRVHPEFEGRGIGTLLTQWAEKRARQAIERVPDGLRVTMEAGTYIDYEPARRLLHDAGMTQIRNFFTMAIDLGATTPEPEWPEGITLRVMANLDEIREIVWASEEAFKDHWGYVEEPFEQEYERWFHFVQNDEDFDPSLWFMAMDGDEIAGVSLCRLRSSEDPHMGWVSTLGVRRQWRRRGVALALLQHSFGELHRRGQIRVGLGVDAKSLTGALSLYEKAGMVQIRQFTTFEKELRPGRDIVKKSNKDEG